MLQLVSSRLERLLSRSRDKKEEHRWVLAASQRVLAARKRWAHLHRVIELAQQVALDCNVAAPINAGHLFRLIGR